MMDKIYLNDLTIGTTWTSREHTLTEADIIEFAQQYDPQPFHTDPERAKDSFFGTLVASGWQTACLTMRLMVETIPIATGLIGASGSVKWGRPTYPNDRIPELVDSLSDHYDQVVGARRSRRPRRTRRGVPSRSRAHGSPSTPSRAGQRPAPRGSRRASAPRRARPRAPPCIARDDAAINALMLSDASS